MILYHGSKEVVEYPEIRKARFNKDFYFGFYCTNIEKQAERWAIRYGKKGYINKYEYTENPRLNILKFAATPDDRVSIAGTFIVCEIQICFFPACLSSFSHKIFFISPSVDKLIP